MWRWYPWLAVLERGDMQSLSLFCMGVTESFDEPRVPPLRKDFWQPVAQEIFSDDANMIQMSDSARAYQEVWPRGVVEMWKVNHSENEFTRPEQVLADVATGDRRHGIIGTQFLDSEWGRIHRALFLRMLWLSTRLRGS